MRSDGSSGFDPSLSDMLVKTGCITKAEKPKKHWASFSLTAAMTLHPGTAEGLLSGEEADRFVLLVKCNHGDAFINTNKNKTTFTVTEMYSVHQEVPPNESLLLQHTAYVIPHLARACVCVCVVCRWASKNGVCMLLLIQGAHVNVTIQFIFRMIATIILL